MAVSALINLAALLDDTKCFDLVRQYGGHPQWS